MVRRLLAAMLLLLAQAAGAAAPVEMHMKSSSVEFGEPFRLELRAPASAPPLDTLDLAPLYADFAVETPDPVETAAHGEQRWKMRLFARHPGRLTIPPLTLQGQRTRPLQVVATPALDRTDRRPIRVAGRHGHTSVWTQQAVTVTMEVETGSRFARLEADSAQPDGLLVLGPTRTRHPPEGEDKGRMRFTLRWTVYPQRAGDTALQLPPVRYVRDGVTTHRFYPPRLQLHVRPLPEYLPPTMAVGRIGLDVRLPQAAFLVTDRLAFLHLRISDAGPPGRTHAALLRQLTGGAAVRFYPPRVVKDGAPHESVYEVPFAARTMGLVALPSVRVQYFDPQSGRIRTRIYALGRALVLSSWTIYAGAVALALLVLFIVWQLWRIVRARWHAHRHYAAALQHLHTGDDADSVKSALGAMAEAEGWRGNITLAVWSRKWRHRFPGRASVSESVLQLQAALYGRTPLDLGPIRAAIIEACWQRAPLLWLRARAHDTLSRVRPWFGSRAP